MSQGAKTREELERTLGNEQPVWIPVLPSDARYIRAVMYHVFNDTSFAPIEHFHRLARIAQAMATAEVRA